MRLWLCRFVFVGVLALSVSALAQEAPKPSEDTTDLKALIFVLQTKLVAVEKELGEEKARRAALELAELQKARETLAPEVKRKLGLPVPEPAKPAEKAPPKN